jgi:receptor protein-tyrosine kinase
VLRAALPRRRGAKHAVAIGGSNGNGTIEFGASFMFAEAFRRLQVALRFAARSENLRSILVASPHAGEGKSTVVLNLARAFHDSGVPIVVADTDFERPTLHRTMTAKSAAGFVDVLEARASVEETLAARGAALTSQGRGALATARLRDVMTAMSERADLLLCDSAPVLLVPENLFLAASVDGVVLVARAGSTTSGELAAAKARLDDVGARILGVVINEVPPSSLTPYYKRYYRTYMRSGHP